MERAPILSFSSPPSEGRRADVIASPTLELAYALFFLAHHPASERRRHELPWLDTLYRDAPSLPQKVASFWPESANYAAIELFFLVCVGGYARDPSPERLLGDLPDLPERLGARARTQAAAKGTDEHERKMSDVMIGRLAALGDPEVLGRYRTMLEALWAQLLPHWEQAGRAAVEQERRTLQGRLEAGEEVLSVLPPHHFTQFEAGADALRAVQSGGRLLIIPLSIASGGGFNFDLEGVRYLGYGLRTEETFADLRARAEAAAARAKALADPTRLTLLALIRRYADLHITVGDLARQLGVSQPTASGHLKLLKQAGLVIPEKRGTRTVYHADPAATSLLLSDLRDLLNLPE